MDKSKRDFLVGRMGELLLDAAESIRNINANISQLTDSLDIKDKTYPSVDLEVPIEEDDLYLNLAIKYMLSTMKAQYGSDKLFELDQIHNIVYKSDHIIYQLKNGLVYANSIYVREKFLPSFLKKGMGEPINYKTEKLLDDGSLLHLGHIFLNNLQRIAIVCKVIKINNYIARLSLKGDIIIDTHVIKYIPHNEIIFERNYDKGSSEDIVDRIEEIDYKYLVEYLKTIKE